MNVKNSFIYRARIKLNLKTAISVFLIPRVIVPFFYESFVVFKIEKTDLSPNQSI